MLYDRIRKIDSDSSDDFSRYNICSHIMQEYEEWKKKTIKSAQKKMKRTKELSEVDTHDKTRDEQQIATKASKTDKDHNGNEKITKYFRRKVLAGETGHTLERLNDGDKHASKNGKVTSSDSVYKEVMKLFGNSNRQIHKEDPVAAEDSKHETGVHKKWKNRMSSDELSAILEEGDNPKSANTVNEAASAEYNKVKIKKKRETDSSFISKHLEIPEIENTGKKRKTSPPNESINIDSAKTKKKMKRLAECNEEMELSALEISSAQAEKRCKREKNRSLNNEDMPITGEGVCETTKDSQEFETDLNSELLSSGIDIQSTDVAKVINLFEPNTEKVNKKKKKKKFNSHEIHVDYSSSNIGESITLKHDVVKATKKKHKREKTSLVNEELASSADQLNEVDGFKKKKKKYTKTDNGSNEESNSSIIDGEDDKIKKRLKKTKIMKVNGDVSKSDVEISRDDHVKKKKNKKRSSGGDVEQASYNPLNEELLDALDEILSLRWNDIVGINHKTNKKRKRRGGVTNGSYSDEAMEANRVNSRSNSIKQVFGEIKLSEEPVIETKNKKKKKSNENSCDGSSPKKNKRNRCLVRDNHCSSDEVRLSQKSDANDKSVNSEIGKDFSFETPQNTDKVKESGSSSDTTEVHEDTSRIGGKPERSQAKILKSPTARKYKFQRAMIKEHFKEMNSSCVSVKSDYYDGIMDQKESAYGAVEDDSFARIELLRQLVVVITWAIPPLHLIETRIATTPTASEKNKMMELDVPIKKGNYSIKEDELIKSNWEDFYKKHDFPPDILKHFIQFYSKRGVKSAISKDARLNFGRFLARGLDDRPLYSVYKRFQRLYQQNFKIGRFTEEEDDIIIEFMKNSNSVQPYGELQKILNRDKAAIERRCKKLVVNSGEISGNGRVRWTKEKIEELVQYLLRVVHGNTTEDLKNKKFTPKQWYKVSKKIRIPVERLRAAWFVTIHPKLFSNKIYRRRELKEQLIKALIARGYDDWRSINWSEIANSFDGHTSWGLSKRVRETVNVKVPQYLKNDLKDAKPAPQQPPVAQPSIVYEPSLTSVQLRQSSVSELKKNDRYWENRLKQQESNHQKINQVLDEAYKIAVDEMEVKEITTKSARSLPPCQQAKEAVMKCYKDNAGQSMNCAKVVQAFQQCVDSKRASLIANRG